MKGTYINRRKGGLFFVTDFREPSYKALLQDSALYKIVQSTADNRKVFVDGKLNILNKNELLFCKPLNSLEVVHSQSNLTAIAFNKDFYNIDNPNDEVLFYGFWFFRIRHPLKLHIEEKEMYPFISIFGAFQREIRNGNRLKENVIRKKLRLLLIASSQRVKTIEDAPFLKQGQLNAIKKFANLIEMHFTKKRHKSKGKTQNYPLNFKKWFWNKSQNRFPAFKESGRLFPAGQLFHTKEISDKEIILELDNKQAIG